MTNNFNLHIYKVIEKYEVDVETECSVDAKNKALKLVKGGKVKPMKSDCNYIVFDYQQ